MLNLLKELSTVLGTALNSLANQTPKSAESRYISDAARSVNLASDGYILLREAMRVYASKLMIRPLIDVVIKASAVVTKKGFLFRVAYTELQEMKKLYEKNPANEAAANETLERLKKRFLEEAGYPIECKQVNGRYTAEVAGLLTAYDTAYRIYCEYTHSALRAVRGSLDTTTDPTDTSMVIWAVCTMLNQLKIHTPAVVPDLTAYNVRIESAQKAMLEAWGHKVS